MLVLVLLRRRMKVEDLTFFSQETKGIHVAIVTDLSQFLSRTNESRRTVCSVVLQCRDLLTHLKNN